MLPLMGIITQCNNNTLPTDVAYFDLHKFFLKPKEHSTCPFCTGFLITRLKLIEQDLGFSIRSGRPLFVSVSYGQASSRESGKGDETVRLFRPRALWGMKNDQQQVTSPKDYPHTFLQWLTTYEYRVWLYGVSSKSITLSVRQAS